MPTPYEQWVAGRKGTPNVLGEQPTAVVEPPVGPVSYGDWRKDTDIGPLTIGQKVAEVGKAALRMPEYVAANVGDIIFWLAEQDRAKIPAVIPALLAATISQEQWDRGQAKMIKFANNVSDHWRKAAATGIEAKDPRIDALSWSEAPVLKGLVSGIESSGSFLTAVAAGIITKNPNVGLALLGAMSGGGAYRELREEGVEEGLANATALLVGTFEAVTEKLPFNAIFGKTSKRFLAKFLKSASLESLQEFFQNMGENYFTHFAKEYQETGEVGESLKIEWAQLMENWQDAIAGGIVMGGAGAVMTGRAGLKPGEPVEPGPEEVAPMPEIGLEEKQPERVGVEPAEAVEPEQAKATEKLLRNVYLKGFVAKITSIRANADNIVAGAGSEKAQVKVMKAELAKIQDHYAKISKDIEANPELLAELAGIRDILPDYADAVNSFIESPSQEGFQEIKDLSDRMAELSSGYGARLGEQAPFIQVAAQAELGKLRQEARKRAEAGEELSPQEIKLLEMKPRHIREMVAGEVQAAAREPQKRTGTPTQTFLEPSEEWGFVVPRNNVASKEKPLVDIIGREYYKVDGRWIYQDPGQKPGTPFSGWMAASPDFNKKIEKWFMESKPAGEVQAAERAKPKAYRVKEYIQTKEGRIERAPTVKRKIKRAVGIEVPGKPVVTTEREALKVKLRAQKQAAATGYKAGLAMGREKALELKARYKTLGEWRKEFRKYVKAALPASVQGKMMVALENIKTEKSYEKALKKLVVEIEKTQTREAKGRLEKQVKKITKKWGRKGTFGGYRLLPEYEKILTDLMGWFTTKGELAEDKRADLNELLQWAIDEQEALEAKGQMDTPYQQFEVVPTIRRLQKELGDVSVAQWPAEKIDQITDAILTIAYQHLYEREAFNEAMKRRLDADIAQGIEDVSGAAGRPQEPGIAVGPEEPAGLGKKVVGEARALVGRHNYNLSTLAKILSGMKEKGPVWRRLAGALEVGVGKAIEHKFATKDMITAMMKEKGIDTRELMSWSKLLRRASWQGPAWLKKLADLDVDVEGKTAEFVATKFVSVTLESGKALKLSVAEAMDVYMHTRNPDNYKVLTGKNGVSFYGKAVKEGQVFTADDVTNITEALFEAAPKAKDFIEIMETALAYQQDAINAVSRRLLGYDLATLPGYWHIRRLLPKVARGKKAAFTYETVEGRSHWKERVGGPHPLVLGDGLNHLIETIEVGAEYIGMAEPLRNAKTMLSDKKFRDTAEKKGFGKYLTDISWQIGQLEKSSSEKQWAERWLSGWTRNVTRAIFGFNLRVSAQQEVSVFLAFSKLPFKYAAALRPTVSAAVVSRIEEWSPYLRERFAGHISREVGDVSQTGGVLRFYTDKDQFINWGTWLIKHFDKRAIVNVWRMVEAEVADRGEFGHLTRQQLYNNGAYQAQVVARAEQVIRDTQPTWHKVDRSLIGSSPNMAVRIMTMFHSQREKMVQMAGQANATYLNSEKTQADKIKLSRTYGMLALNLALINAWKMAFGVLFLRRKDEPEEWATNVLADIPGMFYIVGPPIREAVKAASRAYRRKPVYQLGVVSLPPFKILETGSAAVFSWEKVALEALSGNNVEKELIDALDKTWEFSQYALGLPFHSTTVIAKKWMD